MRTFTSLVSLLLLLVSWNRPAQADLLVASYDSSQVLRYDETTGAFLGIFATGLPNDHPSGMTIGPDGNLYVGMDTGFDPPFDLASFIRRFDGQTGAFIDTFASGGGLKGPTDLVFGPDGNLYVLSWIVDKVIRYNGITGAYMDDFVPAGSGELIGSGGLAFGPDGNLYVGSLPFKVNRYDGSTGTFLGRFAFGGWVPLDLTFGPDGNLYVLNSDGGPIPSQVWRFDGLTGAFIDVFANAFAGRTRGSSLVFGPDGNLYVTTGSFGNSVRRFDGSTGQFIDEFVAPGSGGLTRAAGLLFFTPVPVPQLISIDIKPGSFPNSINPKSKGVIPVAILTTDTFDAATVDSATVRFGATGTEAAPVHAAIEDVDKDGDTDMILHFRTQDTGIVCEDTSASLTGKTFSGQAIEGSDSIRTVGCK